MEEFHHAGRHPAHTMDGSDPWSTQNVQWQLFVATNFRRTKNIKNNSFARHKGLKVEKWMYRRLGRINTMDF
jgi:hypothetical protein